MINVTSWTIWDNMIFSAVILSAILFFGWFVVQMIKEIVDV